MSYQTSSPTQTPTLDGITGPNGECTCSHCQLDHMIDGIVANPSNVTNDQFNKEKDYDHETVSVYQQLAIENHL